MKIKTDHIFYITIILLFIAFNITFIFLIIGENKRDRLYLEYRIERIIFDSVDAYRNKEMDSYLQKNKGVVSFGVYDTLGINIYSYGNPPKNIDIEKFRGPPKPLVCDTSKSYISIIRPFGERGPHHNKMMHGMKKSYNPRFRNFLFINLKKDEICSNRKGLYIFLFIVPVIFFLIIFLLGIIYKKNMGYKKKIEKQKELVKLGEISRTLSHEIKNPLSAIKLQTGYLKRLFPDNNTDFNVIDEEINRLSLLTNRIGDFLRDPVGNPELINLNEFIKNIIKKFKHNIIVTSKDDKNNLIKFDKERLRSILENLIINAVDSIEEKKSNEAVEIFIYKSKKYIIIDIFDRGIGFPEDYEKNIFNPFYTNKTKGNGLGLSIVKRFIEANKGSIFIKNREGGGAEIKIKFPMEILT